MIGTPSTRYMTPGGSDVTVWAASAITTSRTPRYSRNSRRTDTTCGNPPRNPCHRFASKVGMIKVASAVSGGMKLASPEIMIMGMANPTAPLTKLATNVTAVAATSVASVSASNGVPRVFL